MNSTCPICKHRFTIREQNRLFALWGARQPASCPECRTMLMWERNSWRRFIFGGLLSGIFGGICLHPLLAWLLGPDSMNMSSSYWESSPVRAILITSAAFAVTGVAVLFSGLLKLRLLKHDNS